MKIDSLEGFNRFAKEVAAALNTAQVKPLGKEFSCHVIVAVAILDKEGIPVEMPLGGGLNFIKGVWEVQPEMAEITKERIATRN